MHTKAMVSPKRSYKTVSELITIIENSIKQSALSDKETITVNFEHTGGGCWAIAIEREDGSQYLIGADCEPFDRDDLYEPLKFDNHYEPCFSIEQQYGPDLLCHQCEHCTKTVWVNQQPTNEWLLMHSELEGAIITRLIGAIFDLLTDYEECEADW